MELRLGPLQAVSAFAVGTVRPSSRATFLRAVPHAHCLLDPSFADTAGPDLSRVGVSRTPRLGGQQTGHLEEADHLPTDETVRLEEAIWISLSLLNNSIGSIITKSGYH